MNGLEVAISAEKTATQTQVGHIAPEGAEGNLLFDAQHEGS